VQVQRRVADRCELEGIIDGPKGSDEGTRDASAAVTGRDRVLREDDRLSSPLCDSEAILLPLPLPDN
jgi:hypothetical protein